MDLKKYDSALQYGATIGGSDLAAAAVSGAKLTTNYAYLTLAGQINGTSQQNVFYGTATAPVAGTVTGFFVISNIATAGTWTLYGTTAGTIAVITNGTSPYYAQGTGVLNASVASGDTVYFTGPNAGTATGYVTFVTAS